jgi:hypothetical protein
MRIHTSGGGLTTRGILGLLCTASLVAVLGCACWACRGGAINVMDRGAIGQPLDMRGTVIGPYKVQLTGNDLPWKVGAGIGIQDAILLLNGDRAALVTTVTGVERSGDIVQLDLDPARPGINLAPSTSVAISNDDREPIQKALSEAEARGGGTVCFPSGTYAIGTPRATMSGEICVPGESPCSAHSSYAYSNMPLKVGSHVTMRGDPFGQSTIRIRDNVLEVNALALPTITGVIDEHDALPIHNTILINAHSGLMPTTHADTQPMAPDQDIRLTDLYFDGNKDHQPYYVRVAGTSALLNDAQNVVQMVGIQQWAARDQEPLFQEGNDEQPNLFVDYRPDLVTTNSDAYDGYARYTVYIRYEDAAGKESEAGGWGTATMAPSTDLQSSSLRVDLPPQHPQNAVRVNVFVAHHRTKNVVYYPDDPGLVPESDCINGERHLVFEKHSFPIDRLHTTPETATGVWTHVEMNPYRTQFLHQPYVRIKTHTRGNVLPYGYVQYVSGEPGSGLIFNNLHGLRMENVDLANMITNGMCLYAVEDVHVGRLTSHANAQSGIALLFGPLRNITFARSRIMDNDRNGLDMEIEANSAQFAFQNVSWLRNASVGMGISNTEGTSINGILVRGCEFAGNGLHVKLASPDSRGIHINDVAFERNIFGHCFMGSFSVGVRGHWADGSGNKIRQNRFLEADGRLPTTMPYTVYSYFTNTISLYPARGGEGWEVCDNTFRPTVDPSNIHPFLRVLPSATQYRIQGNTFHGQLAQQNHKYVWAAEFDPTVCSDESKLNQALNYTGNHFVFPENPGVVVPQGSNDLGTVLCSSPQP